MIDILQIECPMCGSRDGAHCVTVNGHRTSLHTDRLNELKAVRAELRAAQEAGQRKEAA